MNNRIKLNDILKLNDSEISITKVKFNQNNGNEDPMEVYLQNPDIVNNEWLFWRTKQRYFNVGHIAICFLRLSYETWLLTTIKIVTKELNIVEGINYEGVELKTHQPYFGRVIVKYHKKTQSQCYFASTILDDLEVLEVLPTAYDGVDFPGYEKVSLSFSQLESILNCRKKDWVAALENQKGVYLIVDKSNGKMYVGSAFGDNGMLFDRWQSYIKTGHGYNVELLRIISLHGIDYARQNFQYNILENFNSRVDSNLILKRESWWKSVLLTRNFGYNIN